jgi:SH3-like domain-containing protein
LRSGLIQKVSYLAALVVFLAGCHTGPQRAPVIGQAYVGPAVLNLRSDIPLDSKTAATVKHGDRLEILQRRRKFLRVRAPNGAEGWTDERQLLASSDMDALKDLTARAAKLPTQGVATTYANLAVHTTPSIHSPSFLLIKNGEKFDVLAHLVVPRVDVARPPLIPPVPKKAKALPKKKEYKGKYPPPPMPKPPPLPPDWLDLSKSDLSKEEPEPEPEAGPKAVPSDNWALVRIAGGQAGWVLTRRLSMAIPDDVAQYAEGHRIVSYFAIGSTQDGDEKKNTWLWTTIGGSGQPYDFDSFRVFVWSLKRHRYETAYVQRRVEGYEPTLVKEVEYGGKGKGTAEGKYPGFSVCLVNREGQRVRQEYALLSNIVRFAGEQPCQPPAPLLPQQAASPVVSTSVAEPPHKEGWIERIKKRLHIGGR